jgi:N-acetylglucosaminyldiphosphoundecaprenol N-acetyl-beta-D-mannosaminyltransferase
MPSVAGIRISPLRRPEVLRLVEAALDERTTLRLTFLNPDYARRALRDPQLLADINEFDLVLVDGNGVRLLTPLYGFSVPERLDTDSLAPDLFRVLGRRGGRLFLFGCAPGVAERAARRIEADNPGLAIGALHGYQDVQRGHPGHIAEEDSDSIVELINEFEADLVVVSLPTPLQQRWMSTYGQRLTAPVVMTTGSYLDHLADPKGRCYYPRWVNLLQLNWLYRLAREPRRLWRRYTIELVHFVVLVVRARVGKRTQPR